MDQLLDGGAVNADDLVPAIDQRVGGHSRRQRALVGHDLQPLLLFSAQAEHLAQGLGLGGRGRHLAQAKSSRPLFALPHFFGHIFPFDALGHFDGDDLFGNVVAVHAVLHK